MNRVGSAYWTDFRLIRESRKITLDEIHAETRIPIGVLRDFESDGLLTHKQINDVYRKSLVTAYASAVGVDSDLARKTVSSSMNGAYDGALAKTYLSWSPASQDGSTTDGPGTQEGRFRHGSRLLGRKSLSALAKNRGSQIGPKVLGVIFFFLVVVVALVIATAGP